MSNNMLQHIKPARIANSILQDRSHTGYYLFVEGVKDLNVYPQFINENSVKIEPTHGKYNMREVWEILEDRLFDKKIAIRDADFIRVRDNFDIDFHSNFFITDTHDSEGMIVNSPTFDRVLESSLSVEHAKNVKLKFPKLKDDIKQICYHIGCLKLANKVYSLGLTFQPKNEKDKKFDFTKFIDCKNFTYNGDDKLIESAINYSVNKVEKGSIKSHSRIKECFEIIHSKKYPTDEIVHGHDLAQMMYILIRKHFKYNNALMTSSDNIESLWAMSYDSSYFKSTELYKSMVTLAKTLDIPLFNI